jgi:hypothetical protein
MNATSTVLRENTGLIYISFYRRKTLLLANTLYERVVPGLGIAAFLPKLISNPAITRSA